MLNVIHLHKWELDKKDNINCENKFYYGTMFQTPLLKIVYDNNIGSNIRNNINSTTNLNPFILAC